MAETEEATANVESPTQDAASVSLAVLDEEKDAKVADADASPQKKSVSYSDDPNELQSQLGLDPTTIVLAKVKGYRAWPAMVLAYDILPENIKSMRPKSVKQAKKLKTPLIVVPVRFFSDDTYIWIKSADLKLLGQQEIDDFLAKRANAKKHDILIDAYKLAQNPPDMEEFNRWGSAGPAPDIPDNTDDIFDDDDEDIDEGPPQKKLKLKISVKKGKTSTKKKGTKPKAKAAAKPKTKNTEEDPGYANYEEFERELDEESSQSDPEYDSDWGVGEEDFDFDTGDYVFEDEEEQRDFSVDFPKASELSKTLQYYNKQLQNKHRKIAPMLLLDENLNEKELLSELRDVDKLIASGEVPKVAFTKSKLFRALLVTMHKPQEKFLHRVVRGEIEKILKRVSLSACKLNMDDLVVPTPEETPAETPAETPKATPEPGIKEEEDNANAEDEVENAEEKVANGDN